MCPYVCERKIIKRNTILILLKEKRTVIYALHKSIAASIAAVEFVIHPAFMRLHGGLSAMCMCYMRSRYTYRTMLSSTQVADVISIEFLQDGGDLIERLDLDKCFYTTAHISFLTTLDIEYFQIEGTLAFGAIVC